MPHKPLATHAHTHTHTYTHTHALSPRLAVTNIAKFIKFLTHQNLEQPISR